MNDLPTWTIAAGTDALRVLTAGEILSLLPEPPIFGGGRDRFVLFVADNVSQAEAERLACTVVPGVLAKDGYGATPFTLSRVGANDLADSTTPCP